jgi:EAL domain-containing protein (putative c-di-GMP-specific phosphodiesterase class I)
VLATTDRVHHDWSADEVTTLSALALQAGLALERASLAAETQRLGLEDPLTGALAGLPEGGQLQLFYQAKVDCRSGIPLGAEALVRWRHPLLGMVSPARFIPLAEQTGLIRDLTRWALDAALQQAQVWLARGWRLSVAVNLSARDMQDAALPDHISELLARYAVPPELLTVEITEGMLVQDPEQAMAVLGRLHALGVHAALDDFGTGYSSLAYLKRLPVSELKIDQSFVRELVNDRRDQAIVALTIGLGHSLDMRVVAEGVEDQATLDLLAGLGVDVIQGYLLSRPQPAGEFDTWLSAKLTEDPL